MAIARGPRRVARLLTKELREMWMMDYYLEVRDIKVDVDIWDVVRRKNIYCAVVFRSSEGELKKFRQASPKTREVGEVATAFQVNRKEFGRKLEMAALIPSVHELWVIQ